MIEPVMPKFYYSRLKKSDRAWIKIRMAHVPPEHQASIANEYEKLYLSGKEDARMIANSWLHKTAKGYRDGEL